MPAAHDLDPVAMTEKERLEKRRFEAGFAFETMPEPEWRRRVGTSMRTVDTAGRYGERIRP